DPTVQRPSDPQDLNRYAYARNNPVRFIDPSGFGWFSKLWKGIKKFFKKALKAIISAFLVIATAVLFALPGGQPAAALTAQTYLAATAAAGATLTLDTGTGRKIQRKLAKEVFVDVLGMSPRVASFVAGLVSHTIVSSAYYVGATTLLSRQGSAGTDFTQDANKNLLTENANEIGKQQGGGTAAEMKQRVGNGTAKSDFIEQGLVASDIAFKDVPGVGKAFKALDVRHFAFTRQVANGMFHDSAQINLNAFPRIYGSPWTGVSHQAAFNELIGSGVSGIGALGQATTHGGWSFYLSSSAYGVNGRYGVSGIYEGVVNRHRE
ncbi:MAG: hypothetical protein COV74_06185, partial [Candidatus Omnitrophica bacterium CG11_big_fil_rev_8_21_14_0_20_45_26]